MITPNRYHLWAALECHAFSKAEAVLRFSAEEDGMWVKWQDYERLKAENERLRKAGDAMLPFFVYPPYEKGSHNAVLNWNAAKEGKQP